MQNLKQKIISLSLVQKFNPNLTTMFFVFVMTLTGYTVISILLEFYG